ncbi:uncharacterized protein BYT42DRAFT_496807 [Radiomyces spectabilis]|uniref:uncharacterized protein n=1 Tax=Radiomyces spectabilis TaxID=64574 RepID=UPI00221EA340|nr:uncharacterized protein BYT42DRAFT_496807 [Radiomyces spectabilis]KAI8378001.1 hypothetical protein BYT42DRAFT_496807 [Radiomyces spectabilis]
MLQTHIDRRYFLLDSDNVGSVYANDTVQENEAFATVPFRIAITEPVARKAFPMLEGFSCRTVLSLFLVQQKLLGNQSFYAPYLDILPDHIMTPFFYNDEDLHYLTNTNIANTVKERKQAIYQDYERALQVLADTVNKQEYTWERFLWAYSVLSSRAFPYSLVDPQHTEGSEVLFPLLDALNHKPNTKITWVRSGDEETGTLTFVSGQQVAAGEQMYNNYGPKSNEECK